MGTNNGEEPRDTSSSMLDPLAPPMPHPEEGSGSPVAVDLLPELSGQGMVAEEALLAKLREAEARADAAEQLLRQREVIIEAVADGLVIYDETGHLREWNAALAALFEFDQMPEYAGLPVNTRQQNLQVRDEQDRPIAPENLPFMRAIRGETLTGPYAVDLIVTTPSGRVKHVSASAAPLHDARGQVIGAVTIYRDVTERRELERQARWQASMLERAHDAIFMWELGGPVVYWNAGAEQTYGFTKEQAIGRSSHDLLRTIHPIPRSDFEQTLKCEGEWSGELTHTTHDGRQVVVLSRHQLLVEPDGRSYVLETSRDITERKQLELRTREALDALLAMAETLVLPPSSDSPSGETPNGVVASDPSDGRRSAVAQRLATLTAEVLGCSRVGITLIDPETRVLHAVAVVGLTPEQERRWWAEQGELEGLGVRLGDGADAEQQAQLARFESGEVFIIDMTRPPYDATPNTYGITTSLIAPMRIELSLVGILSLDYGGPPHEFTADEQALAGAVAKLAALVLERERLLQESTAAQARALGAEEAQRRQGDFLNLVTHELRSPLTSLRLNLQSAQRRAARLSPEMQNSTQLPMLIERSAGQADRLSRMVDDLVDAARIQADKLVVTPMRQTLDELVTLVREHVEELQQAHPARDIQLHVSSPDTMEGLHVDMDTGRIGQVLTNYLTNAAKYSPEDRPIMVSVQHDDATVRVEVRDEGPGLSAKDLTRIWDRFHQVPGIEAVGSGGVGLGLGLYIGRTLIERHGGSVGVQSKKGKGSTFWFSLPMSEAQTNDS